MSQVAAKPPGTPKKKLRIAILASGRGSNLQAIVDAWKNGKLPYVDPVVVISNNPDAPALDIARSNGVPAVAIDHRSFKADREAHEREIIKVLEENRVELVVLAGYMRRLTPVLVNAYANRMINIHPSLLPAFPRVNAQTQAFDYGVRVAGCTVHYVTEEVDGGPIILQRSVPVLQSDRASDLTERILKEEHIALPHAIDLLSRGRVYIDTTSVVILAGDSSFPEEEKHLHALHPLFVASSNSHKVREIGEILHGLPVYIQSASLYRDVTDPIENADTYEGNARIKAEFWHHITGSMVLADDSGLEVDALDGRPGVHSARYATTVEKRNGRLLSELSEVPEGKRTARFRCSVVLLAPNGDEYFAGGSCEGKIATAPRGAHGFGYDPLFIPDGYGDTHLAELSEETKNQISHRFKALGGIRPQLEALIVGPG